MRGTLYIVATPIGNLEDITLRALRVLREADWIACEDTRHTRKLLARHSIEARLLSCHKFNERARVGTLLRRLASGESVALVSDAGTPVFSDPGAILVAEAVAAGFPVVPIPGPSAATAVVSAAGFSAERVTFVGFLPSRAAERCRFLASLADLPGILVFLESPRRAAAALRDMAEVWGERRAVLAREVTKVHEEFVRGTLREIAAKVGEAPLRGELTLAVEGAERAAGAGPDRARRPPPGPPAMKPSALPLRELAALREEIDRRMRAEGLGRSAALRAVARERGLDPRELYRALARRGSAPPGAEDSESEE